REDLLLQALECLLATGDAAGAAEVAAMAEGFADTARHRYVRGLLLAMGGTSDGDTTRAVELLESAWELDDDSDPTLRAGIATQIAGILVNHLRIEEVDEWVVRALESGGTS